MKPKISTGYLTPQAKKKKNVAGSRFSDTEEKASEPSIDENIFSALMKCPEKKKMILDLLASNKDAIEKYKRNEAKSSANSPLGKLKNKKRTCESPTALLRRRALEQRNTSPDNSNKSSSSRSEFSKPSSRCSDAFSDRSASPVPFDKVLDGIVAYVEIKNKDQDRSSGAKAILKSMGAKLREKFTNDVTHVIFKDGSFMTYQKAKLMKIYLVSILWVEFCRKTMKRQPEKQYPALKCGFQDNETSMICSQMQKEYEDIIRDEYRRSIVNGTPLPSTRSFIDRRRTLMTPSVSNLNSSLSSFETAVESISSQELSDREVAAINGFHPESEGAGEEVLILNDPDCFSEVSGPMVNGSTVEKRKKRNSVSNCILKSVENVEVRSGNISLQKQKSGDDSDMELTMFLDSHKTPKSKASKSDLYNEKTPKLPHQKNPTSLFVRRKTICNSLLSSDMSTNSLLISDKSNNGSSLLSSDKSTNISDNVSFAVPKSVRKAKRSSSSLFGQNESFEFGKNKAKSSKILGVELDKTASVISELNLSSDKNSSKRSSVMSSLQISSEKKESGMTKSSTRRSSSMSRLWLSSEQKANEKPSDRSTSMSDLRLSSEKSSKNKVQPAVAPVEVSLDKIADKISIGSLHVSPEDNLNVNKLADKSSMSSLQVSTESKTSSGRRSSNKYKNNITLNSDPSLMSPLHVSSEKAVGSFSRQSKEKPNNNTSFSSADTSSPGIIKNLVQTVIEKLQTPESVTVSKNSDRNSAFLARASLNSDDSEILSPRKDLRTTTRQSLRRGNNYEDRNCSSDDSMSKNRELELLSSVTTRKKTLGSRRGLKKGTKTVQKDSTINENKVLVVNIVKSPLKNKSDKDTSKSEEPTSLNKRQRKTLGREFKNIGISKILEKDSGKIHDKKKIEKSPLNDDLNTRSKNFKKRINTEKDKNHPKSSSNSSTSDSEMDRSLNSLTKSADSSNSSSSRKKLRRLYNPDDSIHVLVDDDLEREEKRRAVRKRKSKELVFINPAAVLLSSNKRVQNASGNECSELESSDDTQTPPKQVKKGNKKDLKRVSLNSSADEQKELLNEVVNKKNNPEVIPKTPKKSVTKKGTSKTPKVQTPAETPASRRKSTRIIKPTQKLIDSQKVAMKIDVPITPINRRSTLDFQPISSSKKSKKIVKTKIPTIVCTKLHKSDVQVFGQIIKKLGRFTVEDEVSNRTTHLVAGEPKRTINMLRAISRGCWVLKFEWVLQSLEAGKWLREEDFEVHSFSPTVQKCRLERQAFGPTYTLDVFDSCPPIYVASRTNPRCSDLKELITICRGRVVTAPRMAKIIVGDDVNQEDTVCVNEMWVLDCITFKKKMAFKKQYLLGKDGNSKRRSVVV